MKLWLISQSKNSGYDTYDSAVVACPTEIDAINMNPSDGAPRDWTQHHYAWCDSPSDVIVMFLGDAAEGVERGIICSSFNAG